MILLLAGSGFCQTVQFQQEQYPFPLSFHGLEPMMGFYPANCYYRQDLTDIDNDGDLDFFYSFVDYVVYFENIGTPQQADYLFITSNMVEPLPAAGTITISFCDIDNDGDNDLFLGSYFRVVYYQNIGTPDLPEFTIGDSCFTSISNYYCHPTMDFVDIDADNDYDLFLGFDWTTANGKLHFYRNIGTPESPEMVLESEYFEAIDIGNDSAPEFCDIDNDNDYDLFIGCEDGNVWYYENIGDSINYSFELVTEVYLNIGNIIVLSKKIASGNFFWIPGFSKKCLINYKTIPK